MNHTIPVFLSLLLALALPAKNEKTNSTFGKQVSESGIRHSFLICGNPTVLLNEKSEIIWQTKGYGRDGFVLKSGNV
ncbi:MAG: hypothetical protein VW622_12410, partial [Opitutae bacterium]